MVLWLPNVEAEPKLTVAPEIVYPGESLFVSIRNTSSNHTFVIYILNQRGDPVYSYDNYTDDNGSWVGEIFISTDELGYPDIEFGVHQLELHVNRTVVTRNFEVPYDDNYRWKVERSIDNDLVVAVMRVLDEFLTPLAILVWTGVVSIVVLLVAIYYLAVRPVPGVEALSDWLLHKIRTWRSGRAYPETTAHLRRNVAHLTFYQKKGLKWEATVKLRDAERLMRTLAEKLDRIDEIHEYFKADLTHPQWISVLSGSLKQWDERGKVLPKKKGGAKVKKRKKASKKKVVAK